MTRSWRRRRGPVDAWMTVGPDYEAARGGVAVAERADRHLLGVGGRAPGEMLKGILSGRIPDPFLEGTGGDVRRGEGSYSALLTPKGRMVSDLRILPDGKGGFLLDLPKTGLPEAMEHLRKFLPPRMARVVEPDPPLVFLTLLGPRGPELLAREVSPSFSPEPIRRLKELGVLFAGLADGEEVAVIRNGDLPTQALDLLLPLPRCQELRSRMVGAGALPLSTRSWDALRLESGRPEFGVDMDRETIPVEAGIHHRAVDYRKGCYTGQEVIIRIRDRGQVNKRLVGLLLGDVPPPSPGEELFVPGRERSVGRITRAAFSPALGETAALAYLRREVEAGGEVRLASPDGLRGRVRALGEEGWILG